VSGAITICVFAKPPVAGAVKTRLAAQVGAERAAALAAAFLIDTWAAVRELPGARAVIASTGALPPGLCDGAEVWPQGDGTLDARIERILMRALAGGGGAIALGADSPGLPRARLDEAMACLARGEAVIGPADDGGFYLLGVPRCPPGLLAGVPWSDPRTCEATRARLAEHGMPAAVLPAWFDVDQGDDLIRLRALLAGDRSRAPATARALELA
jgi:rSAM/selenodomain-associated transferase 1